jgi:sortase (surface protein transpeptidase)
MLDSLAKGDKLVVDYAGVRYGYEVTGMKSGAVSEVTLPTDDDESRLILYTYGSDSDTSRTVVSAKPLGKVAL